MLKKNNSKYKIGLLSPGRNLGLVFLPINFQLFMVGYGIARSQRNRLIRIDSLPTGQSLNMPWKNTITVGCAYDLLRADLLDQLRYLQKNIGYRYCRFHAIFDDRLGVVSRDSRVILFFNGIRSTGFMMLYFP